MAPWLCVVAWVSGQAVGSGQRLLVGGGQGQPGVLGGANWVVVFSLLVGKVLGGLISGTSSH